jgi:transposase
MAKQSKPKQIKLSPKDIELLLSNITACNLDSSAKDILCGLINSNGWLIQQLQEGKLSINKLKRLFACISEPNNKKDWKAKANKTPSDTKGHGRTHSDKYTGAEEIELKHDDISAGDNCPVEDCTGKLYNVTPGVVINIEGSPIASAKKYIIEKLRCALCGELFIAPTSSAVNLDKKYSEGFCAMLMINKYFMAVPLYRQSALQDMLGVPLSASTQWDIISSYEPLLEIVYKSLLKCAANGKGFYIDDTSSKILEVIKKRNLEGKKSSKCYTTGIISVHDDYRCVVFISDEDTAGKSFADIFKLRNKALIEPYIMMDALTANIPKEIEEGLYTLCYCLVHARRNFYDLGQGYDDLVDFVIDCITRLYDNDRLTKEMDANDRLTYHQEYSKPIMEPLKDHLENYKKEFEPNSSASQAIEYMLKRWTELTQFLRYGDTPIDNNEVERALKIPIRIRKNSMFYKTHRGAKIAGYIQSLIYSAAQNDINPYDYIKSIMSYPDDVRLNPYKWLPWNYHLALANLEPTSGYQEDSRLTA